MCYPVMRMLDEFKVLLSDPNYMKETQKLFIHASVHFPYGPFFSGIRFE